MTAALDIPYSVCILPCLTPWIEAMLTMLPFCPARSNRLAASRAMKNAPRWFTAMSASYSASVASTARLGMATPAQFRTMSQTLPPKQASARSKQAPTCSAFDTSSSTAYAPGRCPFSRSAKACSLSVRRAQSTTSAPASCSTAARCAPMPLLAPVIKAQRPPNDSSEATLGLGEDVIVHALTCAHERTSGAAASGERDAA
mmetsp:Transcript_71156/g.230421  ORF Transcript_71156/g.230421 Transcript_71156/m.230421 type:complete len:201 (+) Transcript_71156:347-949(+)